MKECLLRLIQCLWQVYICPNAPSGHFTNTDTVIQKPNNIIFIEGRKLIKFDKFNRVKNIVSFCDDYPNNTKIDDSIHQTILKYWGKDKKGNPSRPIIKGLDLK